MTIGPDGHLKFKQLPSFSNISLIGAILISWGITLFEYSAQVPANRIGFAENGCPFHFGR